MRTRQDLYQVINPSSSHSFLSNNMLFSLGVVGMVEVENGIIVARDRANSTA